MSSDEKMPAKYAALLLGLCQAQRQLIEAIEQYALSERADAAGRDGESGETCADDLTAMLRKAHRRMTQKEIFVEAQRQGLRWSESTIRHALAELAEEGVRLNNRPDTTPRGYGLPEWDDE